MKKVPNRLVVGLFWGDEGKAKIVDLLTEKAYLVVRYQGGANAGHSVEIADKRFILHQIPTGILHPDVQCVLGAGNGPLPTLVQNAFATPTISSNRRISIPNPSLAPPADVSELVT